MCGRCAGEHMRASVPLRKGKPAAFPTQRTVVMRPGMSCVPDVPPLQWARWQDHMHARWCCIGAQSRDAASTGPLLSIALRVRPHSK